MFLFASLMLFANFVFAQEAESSGEGDFVLEEIIVTGSRIRTSGMETPTPVTVVNVEEVNIMSPVALVDGLAELPQFYGSNTTQSPGSFFTSSGSGNLNLRGLNDKRTLQLLSGRRVVPSTIFGGPDVNLFPSYLMRSVETVTGGASAAYGTDAVAGVVNFILDTDYEGVKGKIQYGVNEKGHGENYEYAIAGGFDFKNGLHLLLSGEKSKQDPIWGNDIYDYDWYDGWSLIANPDSNAGTTPDNPWYLPARQVRSIVTSLDGVFLFGNSPSFTNSAIGNNYAMNPDGTVSQIVKGELCNNQGCSYPNGGSVIDDPIGEASAGQISPQNSRENYFGYAEYDLTANLMVYGQFMFGKNENTNKNLGGSFSTTGNRFFTIYRENPFLPDEIAQIMDANNMTSVKFSRMGSSEDIGYDAYTTQRQETTSYTAGAEYNVTSGVFDGWQVKSYYQYGETHTEAIQRGGIRLDRIYLAMDAVTDPATGLPACNVTVTSGLYPDCVPLNLFGRGNASAAAVDWVVGFETGDVINAHGFLDADHYLNHTYTSGPNKQRVITINQHVFEISADGDIWEGWGAGPLKASLGYNYRTEGFEQFLEAGLGGNINGDPRFRPVMANNAALGIRGVAGGAAASGNSVEIQFSNVPFARGSQDVHEAFGEVLIPLLADLPFVKQLNFSGAYRWAKYSGSGETESWKTGLDWSVLEDLRLRGTVSQDVRAATIGEKYDRTGGLGFIYDTGLDPTKPLSVFKTITTFSNGSPDIKPENAKTYTTGLVYMPRWLRGLSISADWYEIEVTDNINQIGAQAVIDGCYEDGDVDLCAMIIRGGDPTTDVNGNPINNISLVGVPYYNQASTKSAGIDFEIAYNRAVDWLGGGESIMLRFLGSYLDERSSTDSAGTTTQFAGLIYPEWTANLSASYYRGPLGLSLTARYRDEMPINRNWNQMGTSTRWDVFDNVNDETITLDGRINYRFDFSNWNLSVFLNVNNVLDEGPDRYLAGEFNSGFTPDTGKGVNGDQRGRRYTFGMNFNF